MKRRTFMLILAAALCLLPALGACTPAGDTPTVAPTDTAADPDSGAVTESDTLPVTGTAPEPESATEPNTETATDAATEAPVAGTDSGIVRDGTPRKYFTLSFDDGITQDLRLIGILKKYGMDNCTFFINTGLMGANWAWVGGQFNRPDVSHLRFTEEELKTGIYAGFDLECHTATHPSLKALSNRRVQREIERDVTKIQEISGIRPVGMAWPGGDTEFNRQNIKVILEKTDVRFARCTTPTYAFTLPENFMRWRPSCSISDGNVLELAEQFLHTDCTEDMLFYVWGHGYELDLFGTWDRFEQLVSKMAEAAGRGEIVPVTNAEFYQLFKNDIPSLAE